LLGTWRPVGAGWSHQKHQGSGPQEVGRAGPALAGGGPQPEKRSGKSPVGASKYFQGPPRLHGNFRTNHRPKSSAKIRNRGRKVKILPVVFRGERQNFLGAWGCAGPPVCKQFFRPFHRGGGGEPSFGPPLFMKISRISGPRITDGAPDSRKVRGSGWPVHKQATGRGAATVWGGVWVPAPRGTRGRPKNKGCNPTTKDVRGHPRGEAREGGGGIIHRKGFRVAGPHTSQIKECFRPAGPGEVSRPGRNYWETKIPFF